jgi:hypothetical protein
MRENLNIADPRSAAVLETPSQRRILFLLVDRARSLSELSRVTHAPLNLLHHHVWKFIGLGLVRIEREEARSGAPMKFYRATARAYFVPAELMKHAPGASLNLQLRASLERSLALSLQGAVYFHDGQGPRMRLVRDSDRRATVAETWLELHLGETAASDLAHELRALLDRFQSRPGKGGRRYLVHAAIAPVS